MPLHLFTFNPFRENTYVLSNERKECMVVDPGMSDRREEEEMLDFIRKSGLTPVMILNTHGHIDHILGVDTLKKAFGIPFVIHENELPVLERAPVAAQLWNVSYSGCPAPDRFVKEGETIDFGEFRLEVLEVPGHSPGHIALVDHGHSFVLGGDVLFRESVGRVDLPGANHEDLIRSIQEKLYRLPDHYQVYPGHGEMTTIGHEKRHNPFVRPDQATL